VNWSRPEHHALSSPHADREGAVSYSRNGLRNRQRASAEISKIVEARKKKRKKKKKHGSMPKAIAKSRDDRLCHAITSTRPARAGLSSFKSAVAAFPNAGFDNGQQRA